MAAFGHIPIPDLHFCFALPALVKFTIFYDYLVQSQDLHGTASCVLVGQYGIVNTEQSSLIYQLPSIVLISEHVKSHQQTGLISRK